MMPGRRCDFVSMQASMVFEKGYLLRPDRIAVVASSPRRGRRCRARVVAVSRTGRSVGPTTPLALAEKFTPFEFAVSGGRTE